MAVPQPRKPNLDSVLDETVYKLFTDTVTNIGKELAKLIVKNAGIPLASGKPMVELYGAYGKHFGQLFFATMKSESDFVRIREMNRALQGHLRLIDLVMKRSAVPEQKVNGVLVLMMALLDRRITSLYAQEQARLRHEAQKIIKSFDALLSTNASIDNMASIVVLKACNFVHSAPIRNQYDNLANHGVAKQTRELCAPGDELLHASNRLVNHRNTWARAMALPSIAGYRTHQQLRDACDCIF